MRIFLSSTFKDMQQERDILVRNVFPKIKEIAEERGIPFSWCDLRWGVSSFKDENIIRICLQNIDDCHPYFFGLVGQRYGSTPSTLNHQELIRLSNLFKGLHKFIKKSLGFTEIEMRYELEKKDFSRDCCFICYIGQLSKATLFNRWKNFILKILRRRFIDEFSIENMRINNWRKYILHKIRPFMIEDNDNELTSLENKAFDLLKGFIESLPKADNPRQSIIYTENKEYLNDICSKYIEFKERNYIKDFLIDFLKFKEPTEDALILKGQHGSGKTYFAGYYIMQYCHNCKNTIFVYSLAGISRKENTPIEILRNLLYQISSQLDSNVLDVLNSNSLSDLQSGLYDVLSSTNKQVIILIDGIDENLQATQEHKYAIFSWLPQKLSHVKYIVTSTLVHPRHIRSCELSIDITPDARKIFICEYCKKVYSSDYSRNTILDNLCNSTSFDYVTSKAIIDEFFTANITNSDNLLSNVYLQITQRLWGDLFENPNIDKSLHIDLKKLIYYISLSSKGIFEYDIQDICSSTDAWTILYYYINPFVDNHCRVLINKNLADCILNNHEHQSWRQDMINFLTSHNDDNRYTLELLYQYEISGDIESFLKLLSKKEIFNYIYETDKYLLISHFLELEKGGKLELLIQNFIKDDDSSDTRFFYNLAELFANSLPRMNTVSILINKTLSFYSQAAKDPLWVSCILLKIEITINEGRLDYSNFLLDKIENELLLNSSLATKKNKAEILYAKSQVYDNDFINDKERQSACEYYEQILKNFQNEINLERYAKCIFRLYLLKFLSSKEDSIPYAKRFVNFYRNHVDVGTRLYYKYGAKYYRCLANHINTFNFIHSPAELDTHLEILKKEVQDIYGNQVELCDILFEEFDIYNNFIDKNWKYKWILKNQSIVNEFYDIAKPIYQNENLQNIIHISFALIKLYADILDYSIKYEEIVQKAIQTYEHLCEYCAYKKIDIKYNRLTPRLLHNMSHIYCTSNYYKQAIETINQAITIKMEFYIKEDDSIFKSQRRKIDILILEILFLYSKGISSSELNEKFDEVNAYIKEVLSITKNLEIEHAKKEKRLKELNKQLEKIKPENIYIMIFDKKFQDCCKVLYEILTDSYNSKLKNFFQAMVRDLELAKFRVTDQSIKEKYPDFELIYKYFVIYADGNEQIINKFRELTNKNRIILDSFDFIKKNL